jgi:7-cyano-7-deazaguanine reductase
MALKSAYQGLQENIRKIALPRIEVWENRYTDKKYLIEIEFPEFTCLCPKTGLPDFALLELKYLPGKWCVELKSLKLYLLAFRNLGIFHEHVANRVLEDFVKAVKPRFANLRGEFNVRGGIKTVVVCQYGKPPKQGE